MIPRPCQACGTPTLRTRCNNCQTLHNRTKPKRTNRTHYSGDYQRRAKQLVATATHCWICGKGPKPNDPFTADHIYPGQPDSPLLPAHRTCNSRKGNRYIPPPEQNGG